MATEKARDYAEEVSFVLCCISKLKEAVREGMVSEAGREGGCGMKEGSSVQRGVGGKCSDAGRGGEYRAKEMPLLQRGVRELVGERAGNGIFERGEIAGCPAKERVPIET